MTSKEFNPQELTDLLLIGRLQRPYGLKGGLHFLPEVGDADYTGSTVYIKHNIFNGVGYRQHLVKNYQKDAAKAIIWFDGIDDRSAAEVWRSSPVYIDPNAIESDDGGYYHHEIVGCMVYSTCGLNLGQVKCVIATGANDVLELEDAQGKSILIPYTDEVILEVSVIKKTILINLLEGLIE